MTTRPHPSRFGAAVACLGLVVLAGCSAGDASAPYRFHTGGSVVENSPQLRSQKAAAHIATCPTVRHRQPVAGGLPAATLPCLGGGPDVDLASLRGPLVVNFWAQSCQPCRQESPLLQRLSVAARGDVAVLGVDFYDLLPSHALAFAAQYGIRYPQVADPAAATKAALRVQALPQTFLVDAAGRVVYRQVGPFTSQADLDAAVGRYLGVTVPVSRS